MIVKNVDNLIRVPETLPLEIAALLPCGALRAYAAVQRAKPFVQAKMDSQGMYYNQPYKFKTISISVYSISIYLVGANHKITEPIKLKQVIWVMI